MGGSASAGSPAAPHMNREVPPMKVKLLVGRAGADFSQSPGEIVDLPTDEAQRYVESGQAELVNKPKRAAAAKPAVERAEKRGSGKASE